MKDLTPLKVRLERTSPQPRRISTRAPELEGRVAAGREPFALFVTHFFSFRLFYRFRTRAFCTLGGLPLDPPQKCAADFPFGESPCSRDPEGQTSCGRATWIGNSKNTLRGYCLDIPRFEESLSNQKHHEHTFEEQGI